MHLYSVIMATLLTCSVNLLAKQYGEPLTLTQTTKISEILAQPTKYVGQKVLVDGMVTAVCESRGCWMNIASDKAFQDIQIKVVDGVIVFPISAQGKMAKVEGIVEELDEYGEIKIRASKHKNSDYKGDAKSHTKNSYRIRALGADIVE